MGAPITGLVFTRLPWWLKTVKNPPAVWETWVRSLGLKDPLEEGMATHPSILAWRSPWTGEPGRLQSTRSQRVRHDGLTFSLSKKRCYRGDLFPSPTCEGKGRRQPSRSQKERPYQERKRPAPFCCCWPCSSACRILVPRPGMGPRGLPPPLHPAPRPPPITHIGSVES